MSAVDQPAGDLQTSAVPQKSPDLQGGTMQQVADTRANTVREREVQPLTASQPAAENGRPVYIPATQGTAPREEPKPIANATPNEPGPAPNNTAKPANPKEVAKTDVPKPEEPKSEAGKEGEPIDVGPLIGYATRQAPPIYPPAAKMVRASGLVRVDVTVNEQGDVTTVQKTTGPPLLQNAAKDAVRKWKFKPFIRDGQPVKANGYVSFNFSL